MSEEYIDFADSIKKFKNLKKKIVKNPKLEYILLGSPPGEYIFAWISH